MTKEELSRVVKPIVEAYTIENNLNYADIFIRIIIHQGDIVQIHIGEEEKIKF